MPQDALRIYPFWPSVASNRRISLCVTPQTPFFKIGFLVQDVEIDLRRPTAQPSALPDGCDRTEILHTVNGVAYRSLGERSEEQPNVDWNWPKLQFDVSLLPSAAYVAIVYSVDEDGVPLTDLGRHFERRDPIYVTGDTCLSMALFVVPPGGDDWFGAIAYIVPVATYHAYNFAGGRCFYTCNGTRKEIGEVTLRRPGGGLGEWDTICEPGDPYDVSSPRQMFAHWDAKFIRWLYSCFGPNIDFFSDLDLDEGPTKLLSGIGNQPRYRLVLSAGHHEYWSQAMRDTIKSLLAAGGNFATFSGNTCFRQVTFNASALMTKNGSWNGSEAALLGLSWQLGGGWWGVGKDGRWTELQRDAIGYTVHADLYNHWVFRDSGISANNLTFGTIDHLIGYECDAELPGYTPNSFKSLATAKIPEKWDCGKCGEKQRPTSRVSAMGLYPNDESAPRKTGVCFNGGTTDWVRVLDDAAPNDPISIITYNVVSTLSATLTWQGPWLLDPTSTAQSMDKTFSGRFHGISDNVLWYRSEANRWELGLFSKDKMTFSDAGTNTFDKLLNSDTRFFALKANSPHDNLLIYFPESGDWQLGTVRGKQLQWTLVCNTSRDPYRFGNLVAVGTMFFTGRFIGAADQVLFYHPKNDNHWFLGSFTGNSLNWQFVGTYPFRGGRFFNGRFTGPNNGLLFYDPDGGDWWLGTVGGTQLTWSFVGNTDRDPFRFGDLIAAGTVFFIGSFTGASDQVLFFHPTDKSWFLGTLSDGALTWTQVSDTKRFGDRINPACVFLVARFRQGPTTQVLVYNPVNSEWWIGTLKGPEMDWRLACNTSGFENLVDAGTEFFSGNYTGFSDDALFYHPTDGHWWLGVVD
jgi:hypothetical protein